MQNTNLLNYKNPIKFFFIKFLKTDLISSFTSPPVCSKMTVNETKRSVVYGHPYTNSTFISLKTDITFYNYFGTKVVKVNYRVNITFTLYNYNFLKILQGKFKKFMYYRSAVRNPLSVPIRSDYDMVIYTL